jgi:hypothetical protein
MRFARFVFIGAGVWGIAVLTPFYRLVDVTGRVYPPPVDYQQFFWGFFGVALAWQIAFLVIGSNPVRFRPLMIPAVVEKFGWVVTLLVLRAQARISAGSCFPSAWNVRALGGTPTFGGPCRWVTPEPPRAVCSSQR